VSRFLIRKKEAMDNAEGEKIEKLFSLLKGL